MKKGNQTLILFAVLASLIAVYFILSMLNSGSRSKSFRSELVTFDSAQVSRITINKGVESTELIRSDTGWIVRTKEDKYVRADNMAITSLFRSLLTIKPGRIAANNRKRWQEFGVDSTGTAIQIFNGKELNTAIILGRMSLKDQRNYYSYVRLKEDQEVYTAPGFISTTISARTPSYRNKTLLRLDDSRIKKMTFSYPGDSSFVLLQDEQDSWELEEETIDSTLMAQYISSIRVINGTDFNNDFNLRENSPTYSFGVTYDDETEVFLQCFKNNGDILHSSLNRESVFIDESGSIVERIFKGKDHFLIN
jgi:hypothetical protein